MTIEEIQSKLLSLVDDKLILEKELEVYKKALELACSADGMFWESEYNDYLKKARGENYG